MMLKLLKSYNLLFLLIAILLSGSTRLYAQQGNASNFSIYGDLYSGTPVLTSPLADDWFQGTTGNGMIDESQTVQFNTWTQAQRNDGFTTRSPYNQYKVLGGFLLYDAVYGRDHVNFGSGTGGRDKSAFRGSSGKYVDDPQSAWDLGTDETVGNSVDLVDVYAHLRRQGVTVGSNMWLMMGASTYSSTGDYYVDFELYASPIALSADRTKFVNSGPDSKGGHTEWTFDAAGNVTASGDLLAGFKFSNNSVSDVELKIWVSRSTATNINPANFNFVPGSYQEGSKAYGYININVPSSGVRSSGVPGLGVSGPPWGTFRDQPGDKFVKTYESGAFAEVGLNLSTLGIDPSLATGNPCDAPFTKLLVKTKSSNSLSATLKDFAGPYNFLGASTVDVTIKKSTPVFNCANTSIDLSPENPQPGSYYIWSTIDGLFSNGTKQVIGQNATATRPGSYTLAAAPLIGCKQQFNTIRIYAAPCAEDDSEEVTENNGSVVVNILANDVDLDNANLTDTKGNLDPTSVKRAALKQPSNGVVSVNPTTGAITYTPNAHFYGVDTFEYRVFDTAPTGSPHFGPYNDVALVTVNVLRDTDNDKVPDRDDLDDDNDGIPDTLESQCAPISTPNLIKDPDFENVNIITSGLDESDDDKTSTGSTGIWKGDAGFIPNWESAVSANYLEIWRNGNYNEDFVNGGHRSFSGEQFVEVSSTGNDGLYQDIPTTPGDILRWTFAHRNRFYDTATENDDDIELLIGAPAGIISQGIYRTAPNYAWKEHSGYYVVPPGQTTTRIRFKTIVGTNFIDLVKVQVFDPCYDFDADGVPNYLDLDSDNDGIPDVMEAGLIDSNNDGMVDTSTYGVNGLADNVETSPDSGVINYTVPNSDASTDISATFILYDFMDVDSDNDGLTDTYEAFSNNPAYNDANHDGRIDGFIDLAINGDKNGWHDPLDAEAVFPRPLNSDYDNLPNYRDLDSDGDGIPDTLESNAGVQDDDNDGIVGTGIPADDDKDGLANTNDLNFLSNSLGHSGFLQDFDSDGLPNHLDIDSDNDGIVDNTEGQGTINYKAPVFVDTDRDGIDDSYDVSPGGTVTGVAIGYINIDSDTYPDYLDPNTDDDAELDLVENHFNNGPSGGASDLPLDKRNNASLTGSGDGMIDPPGSIDTDTGEDDDDGDGLANIFENVAGRSNQNNATNGGQTPLTQPDLEFVGNDRDWREVVQNDIDNDGISDLNDIDDDNDGILDVVELAGTNDDIDGDGLQNSFDLDSDGDGIPDHIEANRTDNIDKDGNGMPGVGLLGNSDVNAQGLPLLVVAKSGITGISPVDTDGDGYFNYQDLDSDNDGISDVIEAGGVDPNGTGIYGSGAGNDKDVDGIHDSLDFISNNDNPDTDADELGAPMGGTPLTIVDADGIHRVRNSDNDNIPDNLDLDSDNDTVPDNIEAQSTLGYRAFNITDTDKDGIVDIYDVNQTGNLVPVDTDGDGIPDYLDLDSDNEGGFDIVEANSVAVPNTGGRTNGVVGINGLDSAFDGPSGDTYSDPNGKYDNTQFDNFPDKDEDVFSGGDVDFRDAIFSDFDLDGIADKVDIDDDNDGVLDIDESYGADPLLDADGDGIPNYLDPQFCTGGALNSFGICPEFDLDNDGIPNHFDLDSDGDGCSDALESGATSTNFTANYQFPVTPVGTDGVPDAVQSDPNGGTVNYTVKKTNGGVNDFMDATIRNACSADLKLVKTVSDDTPKVGDVITFTLTLTNIGPFSVNQVQVKDIIPVGLINISGSTSSGVYDPATGMWDLRGVTLDPSGAGSIKTLQITATIGPDCGSIYTIAEIFSSERFDPDSTPNNGK